MECRHFIIHKRIGIIHIPVKRGTVCFMYRNYSYVQFIHSAKQHGCNCCSAHRMRCKQITKTIVGRILFVFEMSKRRSSFISCFFIDNTDLRLAIEEIRKKTDNNSKNIELVFQYLDELIEKHEKPKPRKSIGYKISKKKVK